MLPPWLYHLLDDKKITSTLLAHDGRTNVSPRRLLLRVKCSVERRGRNTLSSASIQYQFLISWRLLGQPRWYLTSWWSKSMVPWCCLCQWRPLWTPWWLGGLEVRRIDSCVILNVSLLWYMLFGDLISQLPHALKSFPTPPSSMTFTIQHRPPLQTPVVATGHLSCPGRIDGYKQHFRGFAMAVC